MTSHFLQMRIYLTEIKLTGKEKTKISLPFIFATFLAELNTYSFYNVQDKSILYNFLFLEYLFSIKYIFYCVDF